jgi:hypothetical protein
VRQARSLKSIQRWADKKLYPWVIASLVLTVVQHVFRLPLIGVDFQYTFWITWIPLCFGLVVLGYARRKYLMLRIADEKTVGWKLVLGLFMLVQGVLFSYTSFGLVARTMADLLNRTHLGDGIVSYEQYPIHDAYMAGQAGREHLGFMRKGNYEVVRSGYINEMADQRRDPPFDIILSTTPGILGTTILLDYSWVRVDRGEQADK